MPPKIDPTAVTVIYVRTTGGEVGAVASLAPKIGPLGLSPKKIGDQLAKATKDWKGLRVMCRLSVQNRQATVTVTPSAASMIIKALKEPPRDRKKVKDVPHDGNLSLDAVKEIAKQCRSRSLAKHMKGTVKEVLGTAQSVGCTVDGQAPHDIIDQINDGSIEIEDYEAPQPEEES
ncbi:60S ribosomal protein L12 [Gracilariopsis chorda]|uniref:60S ribosomal protein L12 n=1 Tax=Gracilariopsis chorda TaxID=448386 RepID=A0A2V3IZT3_9FLOR|nr:60S ribosomal protein L12 [Gracilariopsis chorda]|eukprot:PXF47563.1 60S ribosomal protein L12 [Gracilariopsis chorda]